MLNLLQASGWYIPILFSPYKDSFKVGTGIPIFENTSAEHYKVYLTFQMATASKWQVHIWLILKSSFSPSWKIVSLSIIKVDHTMEFAHWD